MGVYQKIIKNESDRSQGFTLLEILIVLVIFGILVAIAYPSYLQFILKSRRSDALRALNQDRLILERCYSQNCSYAAPCAALPTFPHITPQGFYKINLSSQTASTYILTATPEGSQVRDIKCTLLTINEANVKTAQEECWDPA